MPLINEALKWENQEYMGEKTVKKLFFSEFTIARFAYQRVVPILLRIGPRHPHRGVERPTPIRTWESMRCFEGTHIRKP